MTNTKIGISRAQFAPCEPRRRAVGYIRGLLSAAARKNGWPLAEHLGEATPDGVQHLFARADWDADAVRDDLLGYVGERLGDPAGVGAGEVGDGRRRVLVGLPLPGDGRGTPAGVRVGVWSHFPMRSGFRQVWFSALLTQVPADA